MVTWGNGCLLCVEPRLQLLGVTARAPSNTQPHRLLDFEQVFGFMRLETFHCCQVFVTFFGVVTLSLRSCVVTAQRSVSCGFISYQEAKVAF